jgi:hypothetical protein
MREKDRKLRRKQRRRLKRFKIKKKTSMEEKAKEREEQS